MKRLLFVLLVVSGCDQASTGTSASALVPGCDGPPVVLEGDPADPRSVTIHNGIIRVSYPQLDSGGDQLGGHMLERWVGTQWVRVLGSWYGDWTFFVSPLHEPAHTAHVIRETPDIVEVAFEFDHHLDYPGSQSTVDYVPHWWDEATQGPCTVEAGCGCYLSGCGVTARDHEGQAIYPHNLLDIPKRLHHVRFTKLIRVERCRAGYFVGYHTDPPIVGPWIEENPTENSTGEREFGLGWTSSVTFASSGVVVRNPEAGQHTSLGLLEQPVGPWWFATLPPPDGDVPAPFVLFIAEEHPVPSFVWQFAPTHLGIPLIHKMNPEVELDGRPGRFQAFLGAAPYTMTDRDAEPTPEVRALVEANIPESWP